MIFALTAVFTLMHPRLSNIIFPQKSAAQLNKFIQQTRETQQMNLADWWRLREFYSPAYTTYNPDVFQVFSILQFQHLDAKNTGLFAYKGPRLDSKESLIGETLASELKNSELPGTVLVQNDQTTLTYDDQNRAYFLRTIRPLADLKTYNGLINYEDPQKLLNSQLWLIEAEIRLPD